MFLRKLAVTLALLQAIALPMPAAAAPPAPSVLKNVNPGVAGPQIHEATDVDGSFYFSALSEVFGKGRRKSDGTEHGRVMVNVVPCPTALSTAIVPPD